MTTQHKKIICLNGHQKTDYADLNSETTGFCEECGAALISKCQFCSAPIKGAESVPGMLFISSSAPVIPKYCYSCGKPYPWTESAIKSMTELINLSNLSAKNKRELNKVIPDLITDSPQTKLAVAKFQLFAKKLGAGIVKDLRGILIDFAAESVKKSLNL